MQGFYTPDLAMADVNTGDILIVVAKQYDQKKDMIYWEFERYISEFDNDITSS